MRPQEEDEKEGPAEEKETVEETALLSPSCAVGQCSRAFVGDNPQDAQRGDKDRPQEAETYEESGLEGDRTS